MRVLLTGGTGYVGRFIAQDLRRAGHEVVLLGRGPGAHSWSLADTAPRLPPAEALVHAALDHRPGAFRGGEGEDPARFVRLNVDGTEAILRAAAGMRIVFLSSRAVYGDHRRGEVLREEDAPAPDSLYGEVKLAGERALGPGGTVLRVTGIYGGHPHKWEGLFAAWRGGETVAPRIATEVHGEDLAGAVRLVLERDLRGVFNVSDLLLDRHELLARLGALTGCPHPPPPRAEGEIPGVMATERLRAQGWRPGGMERLDAFLADEVGEP